MSNEVTNPPLSTIWEVRQCVVFSTAHCTPDTANGLLFSGNETWRLYGTTEYSAQYYLGDDLSLLESIEGLTDKPEWPLLKAVVEAGFVEVRFDADGPQFEQYPQLLN